MKVKRVIVFSMGVTVGYVAGAAAGRHRYEQIVHGAHRVVSETGLVSAKDRLGTRTGDLARSAAEEAAATAREVVDGATDTVDRALATAQDAVSSTRDSS